MLWNTITYAVFSEVYGQVAIAPVWCHNLKVLELLPARLHNLCSYGIIGVSKLILIIKSVKRGIFVCMTVIFTVLSIKI